MKFNVCFWVIFFWGSTFISHGYSQNIPTDIPGLLAWYDASDASLNPGSIAVWADKSGNGFDAIQNNNERQPVLVDSVINNKSVLRFTQSVQELRAYFQGTYNNPSTIFVVYSTTANTSPGQFVFDNYDNSSTNGLQIRGGDNTVRFMTPDPQTHIEYNKSSPFGFIMNTILADGANSALYENGVVQATGTLNSNFNGITIGQVRTSGRQFFGDIAEIVYFNRALTSTEIDEMHNYLGNKYDKTIDLGNDITRFGFCDTTIYAPSGFQSYLWSDGSTADSLIVTNPGVYWCDAKNDFGGVSRDSINVYFSPIQTPSSTNYCIGGDVVWNTGLGAYGFSHIWSTGSTNDFISINTENNYYVTITDTSGCSLTSDTLHFAEDDYPSNLSLGADVSLCSGNKIGLTSGAGETTDYLWSTGDISPEIIIQNTGVYSLIATNTNGCLAYDTIQVTIFGNAPTIDFNFPSATCTNSSFMYEDLSFTADGSVVDFWNWNFGDSIVFSNKQGNHLFSEADEYTISLQVGSSTGCFSDTTFSVSVKNKPQLIFSSNLSCQNENIEFFGGQISATPITNWSWNFGDTSSTNNTDSLQNTSHYFSNSGDFNVQLIGTDINGCSDTLIKTTTINSTPDVHFSFNEVCVGGVVYYQNHTTIDSLSEITNYQWSFGDGTTSGQLSPDKPYSAHGSYPVKLTASTDKGCTNSFQDTIKIHAIPQVSRQIIDACAGIDTWFIDESYVPNGSVAQVQWSFNGQPNILGTSISNLFPLPGIYSLKQTVVSAFGCSNSNQSTIEVNSFIQADFQFTPSAFVIDYPILFESESSGANTYFWSFGDSLFSHAKDTSLIFNESQIGDTINVWLIVENEHGCTDSAFVQLPVLEQRTDLELSQLFYQEIDGYITTGVQLKNNGTTPITEVDLFLRKPNAAVLKEVWKGELQAGEEAIYIFSSSSSATVLASDSTQNYICISGKLAENSPFTEINFENNEVCNTLTQNQTIIVSPYPNPVREELNLKIITPEEEEVTIYIYDEMGHEVYVISKELLEKGLNILLINTSTWANGKYILKYHGKSETVVRQFIKI